MGAAFVPADMMSFAGADMTVIPPRPIHFAMHAGLFPSEAVGFSLRDLAAPVTFLYALPFMAGFSADRLCVGAGSCQPGEGDDGYE